ncbi:MAG: bifunctional nuclease family protein [Syntrophobacterales bacterium]|nr:bifunctional nuclease family protein [Syntrophobacterales bacterium]
MDEKNPILEKASQETSYIEAKEVYIKTDRTQGNMVILKESESSPYYFMMFVGDAEITAIAKEKGFVEPKRPLTHDLYLSILHQAGVVFDKIEIYDVRENTFYAKVYARIHGEERIFDSRPSDAVALALHEGIPIMVNKKLLHRELTPEEIKAYEEIIKMVKF